MEEFEDWIKYQVLCWFEKRELAERAWNEAANIEREKYSKEVANLKEKIQELEDELRIAQEMCNI